MANQFNLIQSLIMMEVFGIKILAYQIVRLRYRNHVMLFNRKRQPRPNCYPRSPR